MVGIDGSTARISGSVDDATCFGKHIDERVRGLMMRRSRVESRWISKPPITWKLAW